MNKRILVLKILMVIILSLLILRATQLQIVQGDYYYQLSEGNRISLRPINAPRGKIIDRNGNILVSNKLSYSLYLLPNELPPDFNVDKVLEHLCTLTHLDLEEIKEKYQLSYECSPSPLILKRNISPEVMVIVKENNDELPGILVKESSIRDYVYNELASHTLGYVGEINVDELKELTKAGYDYKSGDLVGKTGLEKQYEFYLNGIDGIEQIEVNNLGQKVKSLGIKPPKSGSNLVLNLDLKFQQEVKNILTEYFYKLREVAAKNPDLHSPTGAAVIVMDPNSGAILAMSSIPSYNLRDFAQGFSLEQYQQLVNNPLNPLINRSIMVTVPPGSIFKLVTGTAAIENLGVRADTKFIDKNGKFFIPNWSRPFRNWNRWGGEGELNFTKAIARSNNIVFYQLGYALYEKFKGEKLSWTARQYGLGSKTGIDLPDEKAGLVPDAEWKKKTKNEGWYPGDSVNLSIGQGGLLTTSLQLIDMVSAIANGGILYKPYLVDKLVDQDGQVIVDNKPEIRSYLPFEKNTLKILREGMIEASNASYGTSARFFRNFPIKIAGKTGTAQTGTSKPNHGLFVGFAPADKPEVVVLVFLENGNSSGNTLPIAVDVFKSYFGIENENEVKGEEKELFEDDHDQNITNQLFEYFKEVFSNKE